MDTPPQSFSFPRKLGNYTLLKSLGKGGMGEVFLAKDLQSQRNVALKKIREELQKFPSIRRRFLREARIAAQLSHPSIIPIFNISDEPENSFYTMPYVEGLTLKEVLKEARALRHTNEQKSSIPYLTRIFLAICQAVAYAHSKNILHRDLKPENVIVGKFGEVMIFDWGLAQILGEKDDLEETPLETLSSEPERKNSMAQLVTRPGKVVGTLAYLAPERAEGHAATVQTDLYALGVILFQILTLKLPFKRGDLETFQKRWKLEQVPDPIETAPDRDIPHALSQMALRALSPHQKERYTSIQHLISDLESFIEGKPDWMVVQHIDIDKSDDWEFQELILLAKHMAISRLSEMEWVNLMISKGSFSGNTRLETTVRLDASSQGIGFLIGVPALTERKGLMEGFCLWIGATSHPGCQLFRNNIDVMNLPSISLEPGRLYEIRIEKDDHLLKLYIDNHLRLHYLSQTPLLGSHIGLLRRDTHLAITPLCISIGSRNATVSCLAIPDAFLTHKEYAKALSEYRKIALSFPGRMEGREALYRAGTTLVQEALAQSAPLDQEKILNEALEEFGKLRGTAGAPLEYLGKSIVYQALQEWEEEAKCLELAIRRYAKHPLFPRLVDHLIFRLHESSSLHRLAAYHLALLSLRHLPQIFSNRDHHQILDQIQQHWENLPYFPANAVAVQLAFLLARPLTLIEIIDSGNWVEEAYFGLLELGCYDLVRQSRHLIQYPKIEAALSAVEMGVPKDRTLVLESPRLTSYLFYLHFDQGSVDDLLDFSFDTFFKLEALLALNRFKEAREIFDQLPLEELMHESSPLFTLFGCYLWAVEGEEIAKAHFSAIEEMPHPPYHLLLPYFVMGKIDWLGKWFSEALFWEKLSLFRQQLLLAYCLGDKEKEMCLQNEIKKLRSLQL